MAVVSLNHRLIQIAMDGSQKIPQRWLETIAFHQIKGRQCPAILAAIEAWIGHINGNNEARWGPVNDPMANKLNEAVQGRTISDAMSCLLGTRGVLPGEWSRSFQENEL